ncbi:MFS transporter [Nonomuraea sp. NPDC050310]|uniref:MFS transporter n=1 Tax=Nonomuraea sp. NPDC050310 TaxID=3154935 RepID=UPI0033D92E5E
MSAIVSTPPAVRPSAPRAGTVPLLVGTALVVLIQLYASIPLRQPVAADLGPEGVTAALAAGYSFAYAVGFLIYGPLSDHFGRRRILVYGLAALTLATFAVSLAPSTGVLAVARAVQGLAAATFAPTALAYLGEALPPPRRARAIAAISIAFLTAGILGQVAATSLSALTGWRGTFLAGGLVLAVLTLAAFVVIREPEVDRPGQSLAGRYAGLVRFAVRPGSLLLAAGHLVVLGGFVGMYSLLGPHLAQAELSAGEIMLVRAAALPALFCSLLAGPLAVRLGVPRTALLGFTVAAAGLGGEAVLGGSLAGLVIASVVFVAGVALLVPAMIALWGAAAHPARGTGMAVNGFVLFLGAGLGSYAVELPGGLAGALGVLAGLYLVAGAAVYAARPRR